MPNDLILSSWLFSQLALVLMICITTSTAEYDPPWRYDKIEVGSRLKKYYKEHHGICTSEGSLVCTLSALEKKKLCKSIIFKNLKQNGIEAVFVDDTNDSLLQWYRCSKKKIKYRVNKVSRKKTKVQVRSLKLSAFYCPKFQIHLVVENKTIIYPSFFISNGDTQTSLFIHEPEDKSKGVNNKTISVWYYESNSDYAKRVGLP